MPNSIRNYFRLLAEGRENGVLSTALSPILDAAAAIYGGAVHLTRSLYENKLISRKRLPFPVISVGNLTWGGTGKTPLVEFLARKISERHKTPLVLTRGYSSDEVAQFKNHLPRAVLGVGPDRAEQAEKLAKQHRIDIAILDDGLQHWKIKRDVEIVTINAINPFGNGKLLPRGILREPLSILKKVTVVVLSHVNLIKPDELDALKKKISQIAPQCQIAESYLEPLFFYRAKKRTRLSIDRLENRKITTFSGVGEPRSFQLLLKNFRIKPVRNFEFPDHHVFSESELQEIRRVSDSASAEEIITTEKDFYRCSEIISNVLNPLVLATRLKIRSGEEVLTDQLFRLLGVTR